MDDTCTFANCDNPISYLDLCSKHYSRNLRTGHPGNVNPPYNRIPWLDEPDAEGHTFDPADRRHGKVSSYTNHNCRCDRCKQAWAESHKDYMHSRPDQQERHRERERARYESTK